MTIDEAIKHCENVAQNYRYQRDDAADINDVGTASDCQECADAHEQLAKWLMELKEAKRLLKSATNVLNMFIPCDEDNNCSECIKQRQNCDYDDSFKWRYTDEALKLIGEE